MSVNCHENKYLLIFLANINIMITFTSCNGNEALAVKQKDMKTLLITPSNSTELSNILKLLIIAGYSTFSVKNLYIEIQEEESLLIAANEIAIENNIGSYFL